MIYITAFSIEPDGEFYNTEDYIPTSDVDVDPIYVGFNQEGDVLVTVAYTCWEAIFEACCTYHEDTEEWRANDDYSKYNYIVEHKGEKYIISGAKFQKRLDNWIENETEEYRDANISHAAHIRECWALRI